MVSVIPIGQRSKYASEDVAEANSVYKKEEIEKGEGALLVAEDHSAKACSLGSLAEEL